MNCWSTQHPEQATPAACSDESFGFSKSRMVPYLAKERPMASPKARKETGTHLSAPGLLQNYRREDCLPICFRRVFQPKVIVL